MEFDAALQVLLVLAATVVATFQALTKEWLAKTMGVYTVLAAGFAAFLVSWADKITVR